MILCRFFSVLVFLCYSQFCCCKVASQSQDKIETKEIAININDTHEKKDNGNDDTFFAHLNRMNIPEKFRLKEIVVGNQKSSKSLIIYFSYTCPHCREFHTKEFPKFKHEYIDSGKIKVIFRNYIDDQGAYEAAQIIRCICKDAVDMYEKLSMLVLQKQKEWLHSEDPANFLIKIFTDGGFGENYVRACLKRTDIGAGLMLEQRRAMHDLQLGSMPAFINDKGEKHIGTITYDELVQFCGLQRKNGRK